MPAFPDTWQFAAQNNNSGGSASIVVPAPGANIRRVVTSILLRITNSGAAAAVNFDLAVNVTPVFGWRLIVPGDVAPDISQDSFDRDVILIAAPGVAVTLSVTVNPGGNYTQQMIVKGYDL